jgi:hypothetical protein
MRHVILAVALMTSPSFADPAPATVRGETIIMQGHAPPMVLPKPRKHYERIAPLYSDYAVEHDTWAKAWLLLDVDASGKVARMKLLKHPGADLDIYAIDRAFGMTFEPALDGAGHAMRTQIVVPIEWPSYWWLITFEGVATRIPETIAHVPCRGSGPMHMGSVHPVYRDSSEPDLTKAATEPWITR